MADTAELIETPQSQVAVQGESSAIMSLIERAARDESVDIDKIRSCEERIKKLRDQRWQVLSEIAFQKAQLEAIDTDLTNQENRLLFLEEKDQDERYGVPE